jgi:uncharacterized membrane protein
MTDSPPQKGRVEAFSDGVIAIIITIMVLELKVPEALAHGLDVKALEAVGPRFAAYALSFLVIAIMWVNHHALTATLRQAEPGFLWLNNLLLFGMSLIPLVTSFYGEHPAEALPAAAYGAVLSLTAWTFTWIRAWLLNRETENSELKALHRRVFWKSVAGASVYTASMGLAFLSPWAALACFVLVPAMFFVPDGSAASKEA